MTIDTLSSGVLPQPFPSYINGQWIEASADALFPQYNPADLTEITGRWPALTKAQTRHAIDAAQAAFPKWSRLTVFQRAEYLKVALAEMISRSHDIATVITRENGKTIEESRAEVSSAIKEMEWQIHEGLRLCGQTLPSARGDVFAYSTYQPLGVVSIISPWNFPFNVPGRKITPALMAGNTIVFKPSSLTPQTGLLFMQLLTAAGLPAGVVNFVTGSGATVGEVLVEDPRVKAISFTGSTEIGRGIHEKAALTLARTQLEMGGKNPVVVLEDADLEAAATATVTAAFACAGQWCTSTSRVLVVRKVANDFIDLVKQKTEAIRVGNGAQEGVTMGPVCGTAQMKNILRYIDLGVREGAHLLTGGHRMEGDLEKGCFIAPTVFTRVTPEMTIAREEIFGPVLGIQQVNDLGDALSVANDVGYGLCSSVFTRDLSQAFEFLSATQVGLTHVNLITAMKEPQYSFGGIKASGMGLPEAGKTGIEFFTDHKVAYVKFR